MRLYHFAFSYEDGAEYFIGANTFEDALDYLKDRIATSTYNPFVTEVTPNAYGYEWYIQTSNPNIAIVGYVYDITYGVMKRVNE